MKIDLNVLKQLADTYGVGPVNVNVVKALKSKTAIKSPDEKFLISSGYQWNDQEKGYFKGDEGIFYFPQEKNPVYLWIWGGHLCRAISPETITKWIAGDYKYPEGKANKFKEVYLNAVEGSAKPADRMDPIDGAPEMEQPTGPVPDRDDVANPPSEADAIIQKITIKSGNKPGVKPRHQHPIRLPADDVIDLYKKAKAMATSDPEGAQKLMAFIKTILPLNENFIKKSQLARLIREIVRNIGAVVVQEAGASSAAHDDDDWHAKWKRERSSYSDPKKSVSDPDATWVIKTANTLWKDPMDIGRGSSAWRIDQTKTAPSGETVYQLSKSQTVKLTRYIIKRGVKWYYLDTDKDSHTKKWKELNGPAVKEDAGAAPGGMTTTANVSPVTGPKAFKKKTDEEQVNEMTTTDGGTSGYNIPGAFSGKGGSKAGIKGSAALGYTLTPIGKQDMERKADRLR